MSIIMDIMNAISEVDRVEVSKDSDLHGEPAVEVTAVLNDGKTVTGTFTTHPRDGFGGVEFAGPKDVSGLMISKIRQVLDCK